MIYKIFVDEIVPRAFYGNTQIEEVIEIHSNLVVLGGVQGLQWNWNSTVCSKASQFLFCFTNPSFTNPVAAEVYYQLQRTFISRVSAETVQELLAFYVRNVDVRKFSIPNIFFEPNSLGALTYSLKM